MGKDKFPIDNPRRLKDWINNVAKKNNLAANTVLQAKRGRFMWLGDNC